MKMVLLGMLIMWILLSIGFFLLDCFKLDLWEYDRKLLSILFLPLMLVSITYNFCYGTVNSMKVIDLLIKYHINPFKTSISELSKKLNKEDKELYVKRIAGKDKQLAANWRKALDI